MTATNSGDAAAALRRTAAAAACAGRATAAARDDAAATDDLLRAAGEALDVSRTYVFRITDDDARMNNTHEWCAPGVAPQRELLQELPCAQFRWWLDRLARGEAIDVGDVRDGALPDDLRGVLEAQDVAALLVLPLRAGDRLVGFVGCDETRGPRRWRDDETAALRAVRDALRAAIDLARERRDAEAAERRLRAELAAAREELRVGREFLADLGHELRRPAAAIVAYAELLRHPLAAPGEAATWSAELSRRAARLLALVDDLSDYARLAPDDGPPAVAETTKPSEVAQDAAARLRPVAAERGLAVEVVLGAGAAEGLATDRVRLRQLVFVLARDAVERGSPGGSVRIEVAATPGGGARFVVRGGTEPDADPAAAASPPPTAADGLRAALARGLAAALRATLETETSAVRGRAAALTLPAAPGGTRAPATRIRSALADDPRLGALVADYAASLPQAAAEARAAAAAGETDRLRDLAHRLAGAAGSYGFAPISSAAREVEAALRNGRSVAAIGPEVARLTALLEAAAR